MRTFTPGQTYTARSGYDANSIHTLAVTKRTDKTITFLLDNETKPTRRAISILHNGDEFVIVQRNSIVPSFVA